ncbi:MAG: hypothetical protein RIQ41_448 [Candidatus Parcubacteria bacterium]|jgi:hypothetical protein
MTTYTSRAVLIGGVVLVAASWFVYSTYHVKVTLSKITSYKECKEAGFPVMESYPEQCMTSDGRTFVNEKVVATTSPEIVVSDALRGVNIARDQRVTSPLVITGEARGYWYFEASFPAELLDGNGVRIALAPLQATADWMTTEFVPFKGTLSFVQPDTATGTLILRNDNPSGLPERSYEVRIPVSFTAQAHN